MDLMQLLDMILHVDKMLGTVIAQYGTLVYAVLFAIVFCETAFVIFPFLPGDSLLFIAGTFAAAGAMDLSFLLALLIFASISGNSVNYWIGSTVGHKIMAKEHKWIDQNALRKTHEFYERHGGKTVVLARFIPLVRTFAPFLPLSFAENFPANGKSRGLNPPGLLQKVSAVAATTVGLLPVISKMFDVLVPITRLGVFPTVVQSSNNVSSILSLALHTGSTVAPMAAGVEVDARTPTP